MPAQSKAINDGLDIFQQVHALAFAANLGGVVIGTEAIPQAALSKAVDLLMKVTLEPYGWEVAWGPRATIDTYVVAIAGTAVFSKHDWPVENFRVNEVVDFSSWVQNWKGTPIPSPQGVKNPPPPGPYSAYGTSDGVVQLVNNTAPSNRPGGGTTIANYLANLQPNCRVIFTGHSLGGALSPVLPMGLEAAGLLRQIPDPTTNILTLPAAGATPGDQTLSTDYSNLFPKTGSEGYQIWNADFFNTLDIVPQALCTKPAASSERNMQNILTIYGTLPDPLNAKISDLINQESAKADASGVTYIPIQGNPFTGTQPSTPPSGIVEFMSEVITQHTTAYYDQVKVGEIMANLYSNLVSHEGVEKQNFMQAARRYSVLRWIKANDLPHGFEDIYPYDVILQQ